VNTHEDEKDSKKERIRNNKRNESDKGKPKKKKPIELNHLSKLRKKKIKKR